MPAVKWRKPLVDPLPPPAPGSPFRPGHGPGEAPFVGKGQDPWRGKGTRKGKRGEKGKAPNRKGKGKGKFPRDPSPR